MSDTRQELATTRDLARAGRGLLLLTWLVGLRVAVQRTNLSLSASILARLFPMTEPIPFTRTACGCPTCVSGCTSQPGSLAPGDIERIAAYLPNRCGRSWRVLGQPRRAGRQHRDRPDHLLRRFLDAWLALLALLLLLFTLKMSRSASHGARSRASARAARRRMRRPRRTPRRRRTNSASSSGLPRRPCPRRSRGRAR